VIIFTYIMYIKEILISVNRTLNILTLYRTTYIFWLLNMH